MGKNRLKTLSWLRETSITLPGVTIIALLALIMIAFRPTSVASQSQSPKRSELANLALDLMPKAVSTASNSPVFAPGEILVKYKKLNHLSVTHESAEQIRLLESRFQLTELSINRHLEVHTYKLPEGGDVLETVTTLSNDPAVEFAEPNYYRYLTIIPNDPNYMNAIQSGTQYPNSFQRWAFNGAGTDRNLNGEAAWNLTAGRPDVVIAIIDSGVMLNHPVLRQNIWRNPREISNNGLDDDGNGYVDDVNGWDFRGNTNSSPSVPDKDPNPDLGDGLDNDNEKGADSTAWHGTFVASVAASRGNDGIGIAGACWYCQIMALKVFTDDGGANVSDIVNAITYAANNGASVINLSLGSPTKSQMEEAAIEYALSRGVVIVAAAGNENKSVPHYPAWFDGVISVGATDWGGDIAVPQSTSRFNLQKRATFSQYGSGAVDVVAPGVVAGGRFWTKADELRGNGIAGTPVIATGDGTSFSSPLVAGLAGLLLSYSRDLNIPLTNFNVRQIILDSAVKLDDDPADTPDGGAYWDNYGRVDFLEALKALDGSGIRYSLLTSGVSQTGSVPAPTSQSMLGLTQYAIFVPTGTQRLSVSLTGGTNLELYGSLGRRVKTTAQFIYGSHYAQGPGGNKSLVITPATSPPLTPGYYYIGIQNNGPGPASFSVTATVTMGSPAIDLQPTSISFGSVAIGTTSERTLTIRNTGTLALTVSAVSINNQRFSVAMPSLPFSIAPGNQQTIGVRFSPLAIGTQSGTITITSNDPTRSTIPLQVSGEGLGSPDLKLTKTHQGNFRVGTDGIYTLTVSNVGTATSTGTITVTDPIPPSLSLISAGGTNWSCTFSGQTITCTTPNALAPGASLSLSLTVRVGAAAFPSVTNTAIVTNSSDTNSSNNQASDATAVGSACTFTIGAANQFFESKGGSGTVSVAAPQGCSWTATSNAGWVTIPPSSNGTGNGGLIYSVAANTGVAMRSGEIQIGGQKLSIVQAAPLVTVSAASFIGSVIASESIVSAFGSGLATTVAAATTLPLPTSLAGTTVKVRDSAGVERFAPLFFVSATQINYQTPPGTTPGTATVTVTSGSSLISTGTLQIGSVAPALFTFTSDGQGVPAAVVRRFRNNQELQSVLAAQLDAQNKWIPLSIDLGPETDLVILEMFGTGVRFHSNSASSVTMKIGGADTQIFYAGLTPGLVGLDQVDVVIPRSLIGRGNVDMVLTVDGQTANTVRISIR